MAAREWRAVLGFAALAVASAVVLDAEAPGSRRDAELMKQKVAAITASRGSSRQVRRTTVTENEVNAYLAYEVQDQLPTGVVEPSITIVGAGRLAARAVVDLDAVRRARRSTSPLDPRSYLTGHLPVTATGVLEAGDGIGRFSLESASLGGVPIPKLFLQEILTFYSKTPNHPEGISLDDPFALPANIRQIDVERGQAIIVH